MMSLLRKYPDFTKIMVGKMISTLGDMVLLIWSLSVVYGETNSTIWGAMVFLASMIPDAVMGPVSGTVMDTRDPRRFLLWGSILQALCLLPMLAVSVWANSWMIWIILIFNFLESIFYSFVMSASSVLIHSIVEREDMSRMMAISSTATSICNIIGLATGGLLVAILGAVWVITIDFVSFLLVALCVLFIGKYAIGNPDAKPSFDFFKQGVGYLWKKPSLRFLLFWALVFNLGLAPVMVLIPAQVSLYTSEMDSSLWLSVHYAVFDVGMLIMGMSISYLGFQNRKLMLFISIIGCAVGMLLMGLFLNLWVSLICMFFIGVSLVNGQVPFRAIMMQETEHVYVGRVSSAFSTISSVGMPATMLLSGIAGEFLSVANTYLILSAILFLHAVWTYFKSGVLMSE